MNKQTHYPVGQTVSYQHRLYIVTNYKRGADPAECAIVDYEAAIVKQHTVIGQWVKHDELTPCEALQVCQNCGRVTQDETLHHCPVQDASDYIPATWEGLLQWASDTAHAFAKDECDVMLLHPTTAPDSVYHRVYIEGGKVMVEHGHWEDDEQFDFVLYELWTA